MPFLLSEKEGSASTLKIDLAYCIGEECHKVKTLWSSDRHIEHVQLTYELTSKSIWEPHRVTYMHPGGIVSYSVLQPPSRQVIDETSNGTELPILISLHGAGVEADNEMWKHCFGDFQETIPAWKLFPSGSTTWGGDDWHYWGMADVDAAIAQIPVWVGRTQWRGPRPHINRWLVVGHSNGGQGIWYMLAHRPDNIIAAAPVSAYSSIQAYVPYTSWHETEPFKTAVIQGSLNRFRHEILVPVNAKAIPIMQQHGGDDDNVLPFHSRRMHELLSQAGRPSQYSEIDDRGHWFDGVMTTEALREFYLTQLEHPKVQPVNKFSIAVADPGAMGPKFGIVVDQLSTPGQLGKVDALVDASRLHMRTTNILRLTLSRSERSLVIDGQRVGCSLQESRVLEKDNAGSWYCADLEADVGVNQFERRGKQLGTMDAILRTNGPFFIKAEDVSSETIAVQISQNLLQYLGADSELSMPTWRTPGSESEANVITIGTGGSIGPGTFMEHPVHVQGGAVYVRDGRGDTRRYDAGDSGLGAIYLRPLMGERLELVIWGVDLESLVTAARLMPMLTGTGQPDFVVTTNKSRWQGLEGMVALGFFDSSWNVSRTSFLS